MGLNAYFFDTYALYECIVANPSYIEIKKAKVITTKMNLMELHYALLREKGLHYANYYFDLLNEFTIPIDNLTIKDANAFRYANKKKKLSYVDCLGYIIALKRGIKFLTGDIAFKGMDNVEFVR